MKKTLVQIILAVLLTAGCESASGPNRYNYLLRHSEKFALANQQKRDDLVASFKEAYPDSWEAKLLEYDLQQEAQQRQQQAFSRQQELTRQYQGQMAWQNFWQEFSNTYQRQLDRNAYGYQPTIITHPQNPNYWQEQYYQQKVTEYKSPLDSLSKNYDYDPWK